MLLLSPSLLYCVAFVLGSTHYTLHITQAIHFHSHLRKKEEGYYVHMLRSTTAEHNLFSPLYITLCYVSTATFSLLSLR